MNFIDFFIMAALGLISACILYRNFKNVRKKCNGCCELCQYKNDTKK